MILHCWVCSLGGERLTEASAVAAIDKSKLKSPIDVGMFSPLPGAQSDPFLGYEWRYMLHQACGHYPWPPQYVDVASGPRKILTDKGLVDVSRPEPTPDLQCPHCGKICKNNSGLLNHIRIMHKGPANA